MSNTIRIRTTPNGGDKYLKVKLEQDWDFIEILSLKISQEDTYIKYCSDYGVVVGRVSINNGFGVPNAKVSVFIPLDEIDKNDPLVKGLYPFEVITDKDSDGVRYNLLPKDGDMANECSTPIGTFPNKREILDNDTILSVYCKYYKFTTTTNHAGDFMIFGVPVGTYTVHVDADISDIGIASQRPYDLISQGTPTKMFYSPTKFNANKNLDKLIQVKTMNAGVNVQPFWGDPENCEVGISRLDFDLNYTLRPAAIFMGSIYGDQHKHSINKRCRPRKKLGEMCEQVTGPGSVQMIRKTIEGQTEAFDVEGGRVIDDDGTWAYQVPMNLDFMVTNEVGELILSQDPNKGVPTRARVRFSIGMDETGGEGRVRTRARYLVPNNPTQTSEIDYEFGEETLDSSFRDMYWNKIYSVSNFISRFQRNATLNQILPAKTRSITGMKDVDACAGDKTPFPYNKVDTNLNPIFFIVCLIIKIISFLIYIMNSIFIPIINFIINTINTVIGGIVNIINTIIGVINSLPDVDIATISFTNLSNVGCLTVKCPEDDASYFAPGCAAGSVGLTAANPQPTFYCNDAFGHTCSILDNAVGLDNCIAFEMAKQLNLFKFDFYNDWVNGTLFGFLLKYKKKKKGREVFCEYDCDDFGIAAGGVDGNENGVSDNSCHNNMLLDTCYQGSGHDNIPSPTIPPPPLQNNQNQYQSVSLREGLIKKVGDEFFYAATTHNTAYKLFATELISLGSVFECDWQGIPKIQNLLIPTTYKLPPDIAELNDAGNQVEACGMVDIGGTTGHEFFQINCLGVHVDYPSCLNIRHICEIGVDIDQIQEDPFIASDCIIGVNDIDDDSGKFFRDVFYGLNSSATPWVGINSLVIPPAGFTTNFNLLNAGTYNFADATSNGINYSNFRGYANDTSFTQPKHSFYFYFGLLPGKTALDKMNERFFTHCVPTFDNDLLIQSSATVANPTGSITFTFIGGTGPYTYTVTGPSGPFTGSANPTATITWLAIGTYIISGVDALGSPVSQTITIAGLPTLFCSVATTKNATTSVSNDGEITISSVGGGVIGGGYKYELKTFGGTILVATTPIPTMPFIIGGLAVDNTGGYTVTISDNDTPISFCITNGLLVTGPNPLILSLTSKVDVLCFGNFTGEIHLSTTGGMPPYTINTTGPAGYTSSAINMTGLHSGTYITTLTDALLTPVTLTNVLVDLNPLMNIAMASSVELGKQCDPTQYIIPFYITTGIGAGSVSVEYRTDTATLWTPVTLTYVNSTTPLYLNIPAANLTAQIKIRFKNGAGCFSNVIQINQPVIALPPSFLTLSLGTPVSMCTLYQAKFNINISHLVRAPYTINYTIAGGTSGSIVTSTNPTLMTLTVPNGYPAGPSISLTVTDSKGCVSPAFIVGPPAIKVPTVILGGTVVRSGPAIGPYTYTVTGSGGIAPYTGEGSFGPMASPTFSTTITDANGCPVVLSYP